MDMQDGFSERLRVLDEADSRVDAAATEHAKSLTRINNLIEAVAHNSFSLELVRDNPTVATRLGDSQEELSEQIEAGRESLAQEVEAAVSARLEVLRANHQANIARDSLFNGNSSTET